MIQMPETTASVPVKNQRNVFCSRPGFKIRFNMAVTASLGIVKERIPNRKLIVLSMMANSRLGNDKAAACFPKPTKTAAVVTPQ